MGSGDSTSRRQKATHLKKDKKLKKVDANQAKRKFRTKRIGEKSAPATVHISDDEVSVSDEDVAFFEERKDFVQLLQRFDLGPLSLPVSDHNGKEKQRTSPHPAVNGEVRGGQTT